MSGDPTDEELEELRQKKMEQLKDRQGGEGQEEAVEAQRQQAEAQKEAMLKQALTDGARKRLNTVKMSKLFESGFISARSSFIFSSSI